MVTLVSPLVFIISLRLNFACLNSSKLRTAASLDTSNRTFCPDYGDDNVNFLYCLYDTVLLYVIS